MNTATPASAEPSDPSVTSVAPPRRSRSDRKMDEIVRAAARLFTERGYAQTSVQDVAEAVGVLKGSLYYYIDSKEDLLFRVLEKNHRDLHEHVLGGQTDESTPAMEQISQFVARHVDFVLDNHGLSALFLQQFAELSDKPDQQSEIHTLRRTYEDYFTSLLTEAVAAGDARQDADPALLSRTLLSMCNAAHQWFQPGGRYSKPIIIHHHVDLVMRAVQP